MICLCLLTVIQCLCFTAVAWKSLYFVPRDLKTSSLCAIEPQKTPLRLCFLTQKKIKNVTDFKKEKKIMKYINSELHVLMRQQCMLYLFLFCRKCVYIDEANQGTNTFQEVKYH